MAASTATARSEEKIIGANDAVRVAFVGVANRGRQVINAFKNCPNMQIAGFADVDSETLNKTGETFAPEADRVKDFRAFLDRDDIDAIVIATPDHWHAWQTIESCKAGKDVYVEKPLSQTIYEGRMMVNAARKYKRVVQVGIHRRSGPLYQKLYNENILERIGKVTACNSGHCSNMYPDGIGRAKPTAPPATLDWDLWLGPRNQEYQENIAPYKFRWWGDYSSQIANNGVHFLDMMRWLLHEKGPTSVCAMGGKYIVNDDRTIPDTMIACFEFASGCLFEFHHYEASGNAIMATNEHGNPLGFFEMRGTQGTLFAYDNHYIIRPERPGQFQSKTPRAEWEDWHLEKSGTGNLEITDLHAQNFLDCIRSRELPNGDVEEGHLSTIMPHIANISLAVGQRLTWDPETERFTNSEEANSMLHYEYRAPWKLEL